MTPQAGLAGRVRAATQARVRAVFHDAAAGDTPILRSDTALFPPDSVIWRVHGDVTAMMVGGIAALLLQMLHPAALAGVWDYSNFRNDMAGRLRRTARFIATTTYADADAARAAIARVRRIHAAVTGTLPDGTPYRADDPALLAWVHACEAHCFLAAWRRYGEPGMSLAEQNRYLAEAGEIAAMLGADPVPRDVAALKRLLRDFAPQLAVDARTREVRQLLLAAPPPQPAMAAVQATLTRAAVALLPEWARGLHGLKANPLADPLASAGTLATARFLRWTFRPAR